MNRSFSFLLLLCVWKDAFLPQDIVERSYTAMQKRPGSQSLQKSLWISSPLPWAQWAGIGQVEQVFGSTCQVLQQFTLQQESGGGGDSKDRLRSNDAQRGTSAEKSHHVKWQWRKWKKGWKEQDANKGEPLAFSLGAGEYCVPRGNCRRFHVRQPILHYRWDMTQRLGKPQARMREENIERIGEEMRQLMQKLREKQLSHSLWAVSTDPPHHEHNDEFCLMPEILMLIGRHTCFLNLHVHDVPLS